MSDPWDATTPAMEARLTPILDLVIVLGRRAGLEVPQQAILRDAAQLRRDLPGHVVAAIRHSAGPIRPGWATLQEAGERLGIPARTLTRWCETGEARAGLPIRAERIGRTWLVNEDDARKAAQHGHDAEPDPRAAARSRRRGH